jgi:hypothetical protein
MHDPIVLHTAIVGHLSYYVGVEIFFSTFSPVNFEAIFPVMTFNLPCCHSRWLYKQLISWAVSKTANLATPFLGFKRRKHCTRSILCPPIYIYIFSIFSLNPLWIFTGGVCRVPTPSSSILFFFFFSEFYLAHKKKLRM